MPDQLLLPIIEADRNPSDRWPRLTKIDGPRDRHHCQRCGQLGRLEPEAVGPSRRNTLKATLTAWQECDERDQAEPWAVVLCEACADRIVEKHPRLYRPIEVFEPFPGLMQLCDGCFWRDGVSCLHPGSPFHGETSAPLVIAYPEPTRGYLCSRSKSIGCRSFVHFQGHATACSGRKETAR